MTGMRRMKYNSKMIVGSTANEPLQTLLAQNYIFKIFYLIPVAACMYSVDLLGIASDFRHTVFTLTSNCLNQNLKYLANLHVSR